MFGILSLAVESFSLPMQWTSNDKKFYHNEDTADSCKLLVELRYASLENGYELKICLYGIHVCICLPILDSKIDLQKYDDTHDNTIQFHKKNKPFLSQ